MSSLFKPAFGLANGHLQTVYSSLFRKLPAIDFEIETFYFNDGDFTECYWKKIQTHNQTTPIVFLFHGLAGSYKSPYIQGIMRTLTKNGFSTVLVHFRGCSGKENKLPRSYHSGESADALEYIKEVASKYPNAKLFGVGYSLGANMLLKLLGELENHSPLTSAVAISAPMKLDTCANSMDKGFSRFYQYLLLKDLRQSLQNKYNKHNMQTLLTLKKEAIKGLKSFWEFDDAYTAPIHGFLSAQDYYTQCSSRQYLQKITIPTLIIHSLDDPFMSRDVLPKTDELSSAIQLEVSEHGGHVGFISGTIFKPIYWSEKRIIDFFKEFV